MLGYYRDLLDQYRNAEISAAEVLRQIDLARDAAPSETLRQRWCDTATQFALHDM
jgi:hypothetical protein